MGRLGVFVPWQHWLDFRPGLSRSTRTGIVQPQFSWRRPWIGLPAAQSGSRIDLHLKLATTRVFTPGRTLVTSIRQSIGNLYQNRIEPEVRHYHRNTAVSVLPKRVVAAPQMTRQSPAIHLTNVVYNTFSDEERQYFHPVVPRSRPDQWTMVTNRHIRVLRRFMRASGTFRGMIGRNADTAGDSSYRSLPAIGRKAGSNVQKTATVRVLPRTVRRDRVLDKSVKSIRLAGQSGSVPRASGAKDALTILTAVNQQKFESVAFNSTGMTRVISPASGTGVLRKIAIGAKTESAAPNEVRFLTGSERPAGARLAAPKASPLVYSAGPTVAAAMRVREARNPAPAIDAGMSFSTQLEQKIDKAIDEKFRQQRQEPVNTRRLARDALAKLERQLVRENERLGRII